MYFKTLAKHASLKVCLDNLFNVSRFQCFKVYLDSLFNVSLFQCFKVYLDSLFNEPNMHLTRYHLFFEALIKMSNEHEAQIYR